MWHGCWSEYLINLWSTLFHPSLTVWKRENIQWGAGFWEKGSEGNGHYAWRWQEGSIHKKTLIKDNVCRRASEQCQEDCAGRQLRTGNWVTDAHIVLEWRPPHSADLTHSTSVMGVSHHGCHHIITWPVCAILEEELMRSWCIVGEMQVLKGAESPNTLNSSEQSSAALLCES